MNKLKYFFMSGRKKLLYQIKCAKSNKQRLQLSNGVVIDFTEDTENLLKERAGLKLHCAEYKRKYKVLERILHKDIHSRIEGIKVQYEFASRRLRESRSDEEKIEAQSVIRCISKERENLQSIYDRCKDILQ